MNALAIDRLLREAPHEAPPARVSARLGLAGAALLGLALGGASGDVRLALFAAVKVPLLLVLTTALCLPSFFVVNTVLGLRDDFPAACRALVAGQATLGIALGAFAPVVLFATASFADPYALTLLDVVWFALATWAGHQVLGRHYRPLLERDPRHRQALRTWLVLYAFAGVQLAWVLRPFRGTAGFAVQFLRSEAFEQNAYTVLLDHLARLW